MHSDYHVWSDQVLRWSFSNYICKCWPMPWFVVKHGDFGTTLLVMYRVFTVGRRGGSASAIALKWWIVFGLMTSWIGRKIWWIWSSPTSTTQSSGYPTIEKKNTNTRRLFPLTFPHFASFLDVTFGDCSFRARLASINEETAVDTPCLVQDGWRLGSLDGQFRCFFFRLETEELVVLGGKALDNFNAFHERTSLFMSEMLADGCPSISPEMAIWPYGWLIFSCAI